VWTDQNKKTKNRKASPQIVSSPPPIPPTPVAGPQPSLSEKYNAKVNIKTPNLGHEGKYTPSPVAPHNKGRG
jgi:hypothetical protein